MTLADIMEMYRLPLAELGARADRARRRCAGNGLDLCTICNAKSGMCGEDCRFCAQSARHVTDAPRHSLLSRAELLAAARRARASGSRRFGIVTSGRALSAEDIGRVARAAAAIRAEVGIEVCASLGSLGLEQLVLLRQAGVSRYHHNLETSRRFFPHIATTHSFSDRVRTIRNAARAGLSVCSGGIIGMGESRKDRAEMALELKALDVDSVPLNILMPIPGTPLAEHPPLSAGEVLKTVSIFRLVMPEKTIRLAAGRETFLKDFQGAAFMAGANGMLIGGYLTQRGRPVAEDRRLAEEIEAAWSL